MAEMDHPDVLTFEDRFSVQEKGSEIAFSAEEISDLNQSAHDVLSAVISLEQMAMEQATTIPKKNPSEINRLEQKVDFLTELMANVLLSQINLPDKQKIQMSAEHLVWQSKESLKKGHYYLVSIYLTRKYPLPLQLPVLITKTEAGNLIEGKILLSDDLVVDDLTRLVFLFHRRQIARKKTRSDQAD